MYKKKEIRRTVTNRALSTEKPTVRPKGTIRRYSPSDRLIHIGVLDILVRTGRRYLELELPSYPTAYQDRCMLQ